MSILLLASVCALASDTWSTPHPGISVLERTTSSQHVFAAYVDVCEPGMHARASTYAERAQTTSAWAQSVGADVAVNGAFFSYEDYDAIGWSIGDGEVWPTAVDYDHYTALAFATYGRVELFDADVPLPPPGEDWWREMVPGDPILVDDGVIVEEACYSHMCSDNPRTAVGISADARTVLLVAVDGRSDSAAGMTREALAELMVDLGAWRALNLDGGGSTSFYVAGQGVLNDPSDGSERVVASSLGFLSVAGEAGCCTPEAVAGATGTFADVADADPLYVYAEALYAAGVTEGCQSEPRMFCPDCVVDRGTLAVLVGRAMGLTPATPTTFSDVDPTDFRAPWIEALAAAGLTTGCGGGLYCPDRVATRWEVAAFVYRGVGIAAATPTGMYSDVTDEQAQVVEALTAVCVTSGCGDGKFCPDRDLTREEAGYFLARGFDVGGLGGCDEDTGVPDSGDSGGGDSGGDSGGGDSDSAAGQDTGPGASSVEKGSAAGCGCGQTAGGGGGGLLFAVAMWARRRAGPGAFTL